jgi:hypothetical protein
MFRRVVNYFKAAKANFESQKNQDYFGKRYSNRQSQTGHLSMKNRLCGRSQGTFD